MNKIKSLFMNLSFSSSDFEKLLNKLQSSEDYLQPTDDFIAKMKVALEEKTQNPNSPVAVLMQCLGSQTSWIACLKMLFVTHKLIHKVKNPTLTQDIISFSVKDFGDCMRIQNQCDEVHVPIAIRVFKFEIQLCKSFSFVMEAYSFFESDDLTYMKEQSTINILERISPLISSLKTLLKVQGNLQFALENFKKYEITRQIAMMLIKECIVIFDFLAAVMALISERIFSEEFETSMRIYELYEDVISLNKGIEKLFNLRNYMMDPFMRKPRYFKIDKQRNKDIELHVNALRQSAQNSDNVAATVEKSLQQSTAMLQDHNELLTACGATISMTSSPRKITKQATLPTSTQRSSDSGPLKKSSRDHPDGSDDLDQEGGDHNHNRILIKHRIMGAFGTASKKSAQKEQLDHDISDNFRLILNDSDEEEAADNVAIDAIRLNSNSKKRQEQQQSKHGGLSTSNSIINLDFDQVSSNKNDASLFERD